MEGLIVNNKENTKFCKYCGSIIALDAVVCTSCGRQVEELKSSQSNQPNIVINNENTNNIAATANANANNNMAVKGNVKNKTTAIILCLLGLIGFAGFHKFYEGKIVMGIIYFLTGGIFLIGTIVDLIALLGKPKEYYV